MNTENLKVHNKNLKNCQEAFKKLQKGLTDVVNALDSDAQPHNIQSKIKNFNKKLNKLFELCRKTREQLDKLPQKYKSAIYESTLNDIEKISQNLINGLKTYANAG